MLSRSFRENYILVGREHPDFAVLFGTDQDNEDRILRLSVAYRYYVDVARQKTSVYPNGVVYYGGYRLEFRGFREEETGKTFVNYDPRRGKEEPNEPTLSFEDYVASGTEFEYEKIVFNGEPQFGTPVTVFFCTRCEWNWNCNCKSCTINGIMSRISKKTGAWLASAREMQPDEADEANPELDPIVDEVCASKGILLIRFPPLHMDKEKATRSDHDKLPSVDDDRLSDAAAAAARA